MFIEILCTSANKILFWWERKYLKQFIIDIVRYVLINWLSYKTEGLTVFKIKNVWCNWRLENKGTSILSLGFECGQRIVLQDVLHLLPIDVPSEHNEYKVPLVFSMRKSLHWFLAKLLSLVCDNVMFLFVKFEQK